MHSEKALLLSGIGTAGECMGLSQRKKDDLLRSTVGYIDRTASS